MLFKDWEDDIRFAAKEEGLKEGIEPGVKRSLNRVLRRAWNRAETKESDFCMPD